MGQLTNLYVSQSYQGLLKMTDSTNGLTSTLQTVQTGDGDNSPLQMSLTAVNISGSLTVNGQPISVDTGSLVTKTEFNSYTSSVDLRFDGIELETGSLQNQINQKLNTGSFNSYTSSVNTKLAGLDIETGSLQNQINGLATTGSLSGYTTVTTFNNYTGSNDAKVNDLISKTGSYATTGSNNFVGQQNINGSVNVTGSVNITGNITATSASFTYVNTVYETASVIYSSGSNQLGDASNDTQTLWGTVVLPSGPLDITGSLRTSGNIRTDDDLIVIGTIQTNNIINPGTAGDIEINSGLFKVIIDGDTEVTGTLKVTNGITGSLEGTASYATNALSASWAPDNSNRNGLINTGSAASVQSITGSLILSGSAGVELDVKGDTTITGSLNTTGSFNLINTNNFGNDTISSLGASGFNSLNLVSNNLILSASLGGGVNINASQTRNTGSFRTKGLVEVRSGSLFTISENTTLPISSYLTSSEAGQSNIIKGWNDNPSTGGPAALQANYTGSLRITGSNNIVSMPQIRATGLGGGADAQGYISGSDNVINGNNAGIFLNTGSLLFPKTTNNYVGNLSNIQMNFTTSSLAGGHPLIQNNTLYAGGVIINSNSGSIGFNGNILNGSNLTSTQNFATNQRVNIGQNLQNGGSLILNHISSSIQYAANISNATATFTNALSSSITNNSLAVNNNVILGGFNGGHTIFVSGSQSNNTSRFINNNLIGGQSIIVSSSFVSSSQSNLNASIIYGSNLAVSGSHVALGGSAFFGRFNDTGSVLADAQQVVFAVGTGTGAGTRKTGFLIDSGSFTRISGSLSVQGGSSLTGSLNVNGGPLNALVVTGSANIQHSIAGQPTLILGSSLGLEQPALVASGSISVLGDVLFASGSNKTMGTVALDGGNPGTVTVLNNLVSANSLIFLTKQTNNHPNAGPVVVSSKGTGTFTITSNHNSDTDTVAYLIINPS